MTKALHISVVGHTNTGKTSLLRTLLRETNFGEVRDGPSTTKSVIKATLSDDSDSEGLQFYFYDTPGFEDSISLSDYLQTHFLKVARKFYRAGFEAFLDDEKAQQEFEQEAKIIRQLLKSDLAFYVIDCRDRPLAKHEEEIAILEQISVAILPILNFTNAQNTYQTEWTTLLKALGLHTYVEYDTFSPPHERRLFEKISLLRDEFYDPLQKWLLQRETKNQVRLNQALEFAAILLIDLASFRQKIPKNEIEKNSETLKTILLTAEKKCTDDLLNLYKFSQEDLVLHQLDITPILLDETFFSLDNLEKFSKLFLKGSSIGAGSLAIVDGLTGFVSLGSASLVGGLVGGIYSTSQYHIERLLNYWRDEVVLTFDHRLLIILISRISALIRVLEGRGHASTQQIELQTTAHIESKILFEAIEKCRIYPEWSMLVADFSPSDKRQDLINSLSNELKNKINL